MTGLISLVPLKVTSTPGPATVTPSPVGGVALLVVIVIVPGLLNEPFAATSVPTFGTRTVTPLPGPTWTTIGLPASAPLPAAAAA